MVGVPTRAEDVERHVLELVAALGPGAPLPAERDLAQACGVSRVTVRHALDTLDRRRIVERRHGAGTFVRRPAAAQPLLATSFHDDMRRRGLTPSSRVLDERVLPADDTLVARLRIAPGDPVLLLRRLRLADGEPMALETLHVPLGRVPGLTPTDVDDGFYAALRKRGVDVVAGTQSAAPVVLPGVEATLLGVPPGSAAWHFVRISRTRHYEIVEYRDSLFRADRYLVETEVTAGQESVSSNSPSDVISAEFTE